MKAYLNPDFNKCKSKKEKKTLNQRIMSEIRTFCDNGVKQYNLRNKHALSQQNLIQKSIDGNPETNPNGSSN